MGKPEQGRPRLVAVLLGVAVLAVGAAVVTLLWPASDPEQPAALVQYARFMGPPPQPPVFDNQGKMIRGPLPSDRDPAKARAMLGPPPECDEKEVGEEETGRRVAGYVLLDESLVVRRVRWDSEAKAWAIHLRGKLITPPVGPSVWMIDDPVVLARVEDGKLVGVRLAKGGYPAQATGTERMLRRWAYFTRIGDKRSQGPLLPEEAWPRTPIDEQEAERLTAAWFLRLPNLRVVEVLAGEPDGNGKQKPVPGRWTLGTKTSAGTPPHIVKPSTREGSVAKMNPDLVVEVKDGKIVGVRTELLLR